MKTFLVVVLICFAATAHAAEKKAKKGAPATVSLKAQWDTDQSMMYITGCDAFNLYGVKGSAVVSEDDSNVRGGWLGVLYTAEGRRTLHAKIKASYYSKQKWHINCKNRTYSIPTIVHYDAKGHVVDSWSGGADTWDEIVPGSIADSVQKVLCYVPDDQRPAHNDMDGADAQEEE